MCVVSSRVSAGKSQHAVCASGGTGEAEVAVTPPWSSPAVGARTRGGGKLLFLLSLWDQFLGPLNSPVEWLHIESSLFLSLWALIRIASSEGIFKLQTTITTIIKKNPTYLQAKCAGVHIYDPSIWRWKQEDHLSMIHTSRATYWDLVSEQTNKNK